MEKRRIFRAVRAIICIVCVASGCSEAADVDPVEAADFDPVEAADFDPVQVVDPVPPITSFPIVSASRAGEDLTDAELVLGVTIEGESRAYPINMLTGPSREILNDTIKGHAIAATW